MSTARRSAAPNDPAAGWACPAASTGCRCRLDICSPTGTSVHLRRTRLHLAGPRFCVMSFCLGHNAGRLRRRNYEVDRMVPDCAPPPRPPRSSQVPIRVLTCRRQRAPKGLLGVLICKWLYACFGGGGGVGAHRSGRRMPGGLLARLVRPARPGRRSLLLVPVVPRSTLATQVPCFFLLALSLLLLFPSPCFSLLALSLACHSLW